MRKAILSGPWRHQNDQFYCTNNLQPQCSSFKDLGSFSFPKSTTHKLSYPSVRISQSCLAYPKTETELVMNTKFLTKIIQDWLL